ncbi:uncharacterized protein Bfra_000241 [Botrytis fragariae]|uniref:Uncharacterized protein n=1 Tax=Botrytis fragariae TaxID=1964551 RepID=A0A8H6B2M8_9HELO|nr:uncharacterized protein Bfra_000241 [Botrytis fragariae]KAF5878074.1 hypothetical protein Bfra_000241 [Botrytis fragariae]
MCTQYKYTGPCWCNERTGQAKVIESINQHCSQKPPRVRCPSFKTKIYGIKCPNCIHEAAAAAAAEVQAEAEAARILWGMRDGSR